MSHRMYQQSDVLSETWGIRCVLQNANNILCIVRMNIEMAQETNRLGNSASCFIGMDIWNKNVAAWVGL